MCINKQPESRTRTENILRSCSADGERNRKLWMENLFRFPDEGNQYVIPQQPPTLPHLRFSVSDTSNHRRPGAHRSGVKRARGRTQSRRRVRLKHGALKADEVPRPHKLPSTLQNQQLTSNHPSRTPSRSSPSFAKDAVKASINTGTRRLRG